MENLREKKERSLVVGLIALIVIIVVLALIGLFLLKPEPQCRCCDLFPCILQES